MAAADHVCIQHKIEAQDLQHLKYGSSDAESITLSFWVKSNKTGNYGIWFYASDADRNASYTYSISSADTWEKKTITIAGDTSGSGITNDNGEGLLIGFGLASGANFTGGGNSWVAGSSNRFLGQNVNIMDNTSNTFYLTGVQLELGSVATPFEHRSYGDELLRCQRYYSRNAVHGSTHSWLFPINTDNTGGYRRATINYKVDMRTNPTITGSISAGSFSTQDVNSAFFSAVSNGNAVGGNVGVTAWQANAEL